MNEGKENDTSRTSKSCWRIIDTHTHTHILCCTWCRSCFAFSFLLYIELYPSPNHWVHSVLSIGGTGAYKFNNNNNNLSVQPFWPYFSFALLQTCEQNVLAAAPHSIDMREHWQIIVSEEMCIKPTSTHTRSHTQRLVSHRTALGASARKHCFDNRKSIALAQRAMNETSPFSVAVAPDRVLVSSRLLTPLTPPSFGFFFVVLVWCGGP